MKEAQEIWIYLITHLCASKIRTESKVNVKEKGYMKDVCTYFQSDIVPRNDLETFIKLP